MTTACTATRVDRPVDEVWPRLTDWEHAAGWLDVERVAADGPTEVDSWLRVRTRGQERPSEVTALDPGRSVTLRSQQGGVTADHTYTVAPVDAGTRRTLIADVRTRGRWTLAGPALRAVVRRTDRGQLDALAAALAG